MKQSKLIYSKIEYSIKKCRALMRSAHNDNRGVAMLYSLIVATVILAFCLSLLLVTYTLFAQTNRQNSQLQCKFLAQTFAEQLKEELTNSTGGKSDIITQMELAIGNNKWRALNAADAIVNPDGAAEINYTKFIIESDPIASYTVTVEFTYESTGIEDGESSALGNINSTVHTKVICQKGDENSKDVRKYTVYDEYQITFNVSSGS